MNFISLFLTPSPALFSFFFPDDTNDGYHIILKWTLGRRIALLSSLHPIQSAPLELHTPRCPWNMWRCPKKHLEAARRNMRLKHPALSSLYLTVLLLRERLLPQWSNNLLLALPLSPLNGFLCRLCLMEEVSGTAAAITVYLLAEHLVCQSSVLQKQFVVSLKTNNQKEKIKTTLTVLDSQSAMQHDFSSSC